MTKILVDIHEPPEIADLLRNRGLEVERIYLQSGDYVFSNIGVERKTFDDFRNTLFGGRLWDQVFNLKKVYEKPMLIIDKTPTDYNWGRDIRERRSITGAMARISKLGITVITLTGHTTAPVSDLFLDIIEFLFLSSEKKDPSVKPVPRKGDRFSTQEVTEDMLCMLPGIGRETAKEIMLRYPTMEVLCQASYDELTKIPRLGLKKSKMVYEVLHIDKKFGIDQLGTRVKKA
jgi:Fanconi anemia group M protein